MRPSARGVRGRFARALAVFATALGCGGSQGLAPATDAGAGGAPASGGAVGTGGAAGADGSGGVPGSGGANGTGGAAGAGGGGGAACPGVPIPAGGQAGVCGDILIDSAAALSAAQDCTEVSGSVTISPLFAGTVDLPRLRKVGRDVRRDGAKAPTDAGDPAQTTRVRLPNVTTIGGDLWFYLDFNLVELDLRGVETIGGRAWVYRDTLIRTLRLDALRTVGQDFYIADVFALPDCVVKDIAAHVSAAQPPIVTGAKTPANCHCEALCGHVEQLCP